MFKSYCTIVRAVAAILFCSIAINADPDFQPRIAIIGSGVSGSASAYFLRKLFPNASIDVYEQDNSLCGRVKTVSYSGVTVEAGGSVIHVSNRYLKEFVKETGLAVSKNRTYAGKTMGIFDGNKLIFKSTGIAFIDAASMLWRYGLSLLRLKSTVRATLDQFNSVYALQSAGHAYDTPDDLLRAMGLLNLTRQPLAAFLRARGVSDLLIDELAAAVGRVNYGQSPAQLNALAGAISLSADGSSLWAVAGGNDRVCGRLLAAAAA
eukprot:CAMPEP_0172188784 /NCGR_PEP_ID=MMETSP1050-20130122/22149_1 /TAXON_ID=233186 /ORGANISM="Cryptomonas curvata, Strain CCAP979/52" /LENGTH=263 /DNA_ID=CAMNT_0012863383 /DNA_START=99 /DNA_END=887 /DNA_ORIENTATION=-